MTEKDNVVDPCSGREMYLSNCVDLKDCSGKDWTQWTT